jgi:hypothetical protein
MLPRSVWFGLVAALASWIGETADARPNPTARTVKSWLLQYHADNLRDFGSARAAYAVAYVDLSGDGVDEAVVYFESRGGCGTGGCNLYVLSARRGLWRRVSGHTVSRRPIRVLTTAHHGWRDISVWVAGGGTMEAYHAALPFDGSTYPLNPSVPPARRLPRHTQAQVLIGENTALMPLRP